MGKSTESDLTSQEGNADPPEPPAPPPVLTLTPEQIRATPEFRALAQQNRVLAREKGTVESALAAQREEAETARQAAEAQRTAALEQQLGSLLGPDGQAAYAELAELSQSDPMAAALRVAELMAKAQGQTPPAAPATAPASTTEGAGTVTANAAATPPPPSSGVDGGAPLGQASTGEDVDQIISDLQGRYAAVVERNQNLGTRNRVTMRDRASALISYLGAAYLKAGAKPKSTP